MMDKMKMLKKKKEDSEMSPTHKAAKMSVLSELRDQAMEAMGNGLKAKQKVAVSASSPEGLEKGLDKAKEIVSEAKEMDHCSMCEANDGSCPDHPAKESEEAEAYAGEETPEEEMAEYAEMSPEELERTIEHLQKLKEEKEQAKLKV